MHTIHNARITLLATAFNNLAIAVIAAAFIVPAVTGTFATATIWAIIKTTVWLLCGFALHGSGQIVLGRLRS
jgi:hypothetical protein